MSRRLDVLEDPSDTEIKQAWLQEALAREAEIASGAVEMLPSEEVFASLYAALQSRV
jgi:hypothetical protein